MSYESDPSGQQLPGDSDSLNRAGQGPKEEQNSWLLDDESTPLASNPTQQEPFITTEGQSWLLDGDGPNEPSLTITEDTEGDSWLMDVDDPTTALDADEVVQEPGFSASYCEPESTASVFGRLLVPVVFMSVLSVGGLLVWRSMSGLGVGPDDSNSGGVVHMPGNETQGEKLAGPSFEIPGTTRNEGDSTLRGSIQRDGSVKQTTSGLTASVAQGQFGFTPSSQNSTNTSKGMEPSDGVAVAMEETQSVVEPQPGTEVLAGSVVQINADQNDVEEFIQEENSQVADAEVGGTFVSSFLGMALYAAEMESGLASAVPLYRVEPSAGALLSFNTQRPEASCELPMWGPGTPVERSIAMEFENFEDRTPVDESDPVQDSLLTSEQEQMLARLDEDESMELAFLWVQEIHESETLVVLDAPTVVVSPLETTQESDELLSPESDQGSAAVASVDPGESAPLGRAFLDELLKLGPVTGSEDVPDGQAGFDVRPLEDWMTEGTKVAATTEPDAFVPGAELASVDEPTVSLLPVSAGMDEQGQWLAGEGYVQPESEGGVAMEVNGENEQAFVDRWSVQTNEESTPVAVSSTEMHGSALASVEAEAVQYSVPTDLESGTMASIEPMFLGNPFFELEEIGMVPVQSFVEINWTDPLAELSSNELDLEPVPVSEPFIEETEEFDSLEELAAVQDQTPSIDSEMPLLVVEFEEVELPLVSDLEIESSELDEKLMADAEGQTATENLMQVIGQEETPLAEELQVPEGSQESGMQEEASEPVLELVTLVLEPVSNPFSDPEMETTSEISSREDAVSTEDMAQAAHETTKLAQEDLVFFDAEMSGVYLDDDGQIIEVAQTTEFEEPSESTEFETDGSPTALVAPEPILEVVQEAVESTTPEFEPIQIVSEPAVTGVVIEEPSTAMEELFEVAPLSTQSDVDETVASQFDNITETAENSGERSLLDMYSDWNQAEDQGQLQPLSTSKWMNFSIGDGEALPFRMAQSSISTPQEELAGEPAQVEVELDTPKPRMGVLKRRKPDSSHWEGVEIPMHAIAFEEVLLTPQVGPVRVIATDGETIEGRLHGIGQNYVWLTTNLGRLSIPSRRVERVERIDPAQFSDGIKSTQDYTKLPKVRVRMKGGDFVGHELAREGNRITIRTEKGHKMTLVSDDIQPFRSHKAVGLKRRIE